jgi:hypothetical protein
MKSVYLPLVFLLGSWAVAHELDGAGTLAPQQSDRTVVIRVSISDPDVIEVAEADSKLDSNQTAETLTFAQVFEQSERQQVKEGSELDITSSTSSIRGARGGGGFVRGGVSRGAPVYRAGGYGRSIGARPSQPIAGVRPGYGRPGYGGIGRPGYGGIGRPGYGGVGRPGYAGRPVYGAGYRAGVRGAYRVATARGYRYVRGGYYGGNGYYGDNGYYGSDGYTDDGYYGGNGYNDGYYDEGYGNQGYGNQGYGGQGYGYGYGNRGYSRGYSDGYPAAGGYGGYVVQNYGPNYPGDPIYSNSGSAYYGDSGYQHYYASRYNPEYGGGAYYGGQGGGCCGGCGYAQPVQVAAPCGCSPYHSYSDQRYIYSYYRPGGCGY